MMDPKAMAIAAIIVGCILLMIATYIFAIEMLKTTDDSLLGSIDKILLKKDDVSARVRARQLLGIGLWIPLLVLGVVGIGGGSFFLYSNKMPF